MKPDRDESSQPPVTSIVHQPDSAELAAIETEYLDISVTPLHPSPVETFLTPWGIGSIFIFLVANSLLTWSQLLSAPKVAPTATLPAPVKTFALGLDTLPVTRRPAPTTAIAPSVRSNLLPIPAKPIASIPAKPVVNSPQATGTLTQALLPPALQPAVMPVHPLAASKVLPSPPAPPAQTQTTPESIVIVGNPTNTDSIARPTPSPALMNERMLEELRRREESPTNLPFYQREKARRTAVQNQQDATELMKQLPPQFQIPPSPQPPATQSAPTVPGEIIIEGR
jgi:hypothetical protein